MGVFKPVRWYQTECEQLKGRWEFDGKQLDVILICALVGGFFGQKMLKKHFEKAGIVA